MGRVIYLVPDLVSYCNITCLCANHLEKKPTTPHNSFIQYDEGLAFEMLSLLVFHGGNSNFIV